ncbi:MAG: hypothetical protein IJZ92_05265 [Bacteroidaceae bacterium]|nr:hypothetical protein [Bacteroidaceae bacterium]
MADLLAGLAKKVARPASFLARPATFHETAVGKTEISRKKLRDAPVKIYRSWGEIRKESRFA